MLTKRDEQNIIRNARTAHLNAANIMTDAIFKKIDGIEIENVPEYIRSYFKARKNENVYDSFEIFIGTDSQRVRRGRLTLYASVICLYTVGRGAHIIFTRTKRNDLAPTIKKTRKEKGSDPALFQKLWWEVEYTLQIANYLKDNGIFTDCGIAQVHLDLSSSEKEGSNIVYKSAIGYVESQGFNPRYKPNAVAASYAADMCVRSG